MMPKLQMSALLVQVVSASSMAMSAGPTMALGSGRQIYSDQAP